MIPVWVELVDPIIAKAIPIKRFVSHRPPSCEGGSRPAIRDIVYGQSGFVSRNFRESPGQICIICQTNFISVFFNKMFVCEDGSSFYFLKRRNSLNFRSFCVLEYWRNDSFPNKDFAEIVLTILRQIM